MRAILHTSASPSELDEPPTTSLNIEPQADFLDFSARFALPQFIEAKAA